MVKEAQVIKAFLRDLKVLMPSLQVNRIRTGPPSRAKRGGLGADLVIEVRAGARTWKLLCEAKSPGEPRYLAQAIATLQLLQRGMPNSYPLVVAPYISPEGQRLCREAGVGYADLAGNAFLQFDGVLVERTGRKAPREARARLRRLFSPRATRILRVFLENPKAQWTLARLAAEAQLSLRTAYLVVNALVDKGFVEKRRGSITLAKAGDLLDLWAENYAFAQSRSTPYYTFVRAPGEFMERLAETAGRRRVDYAFTLHSGASLVAPFVRFTDVHVYVPGDPQPLVKALDLRPVESGGTVYVVRPYDEGVLYKAREIRGIRVVGDIQLYLDLVKYPARGKEQADVLREQVLKF